MKVEFSLPSTLQYGDCIEVNGKAGKEKFSMDLISDYLAIDPAMLIDQSQTDDSELPIVETQPLQILIETTGSWDINANSPETSTTSHGSSAKRFGFRPEEDFVCRVVIKTEYYVVYLNDMMLSNSEHLVPVGSINGFTIDGDSIITTVLFGDLTAIERYNSKHNVKAIQLNYPKIIECRLTSDELLSTVSRDDNGEYFNPNDEDHVINGFDNDDVDKNINADSNDVSSDNRHDNMCSRKTTSPNVNIKCEQNNQEKFIENSQVTETGELGDKSNMLQEKQTLTNNNNNNSNNNLYVSNQLTRASSYQLVFDSDSELDEREEELRVNERDEGDKEIHSNRAINLSLFNQTRAKSIQNLFHHQCDNFQSMRKIIQQQPIVIDGSYNNDTFNQLTDLNQGSSVPMLNKPSDYKDSIEVNSLVQLSRNFSSSQQLELVKEEYEVDDSTEENPIEIAKDHNDRREDEKVEGRVQNSEVNTTKVTLSNFVQSISELTQDKSEINDIMLLNGDNMNSECKKSDVNMNSLNNLKPEECTLPVSVEPQTSVISESKIPVFCKGLSSTFNDDVMEYASKPLKSASRGKFQPRETHSYPDHCLLPPTYSMVSNRQELIRSRIPKASRSLSYSDVDQQSSQLMNGQMNQLPLSNSLSTKPVSTPTTPRKYLSNRNSITSVSKSQTRNSSAEKSMSKNRMNQNLLKLNQSSKDRKSHNILPGHTRPLNGGKCDGEFFNESLKQSLTKTEPSSPSSFSSSSSSASLSSSVTSVHSPTKSIFSSNGFKNRNMRTHGEKLNLLTNQRNQQVSLVNGNTTALKLTINPKLKSKLSETLENSTSNDDITKEEILNTLSQSTINQQCTLINQLHITSTTKLKPRDQTMFFNGLPDNYGTLYSHDAGVINSAQPLCENKHILNNVNNIISSNNNSNKISILKNAAKQENELTIEHSMFNDRSSNHTDRNNSVKKHMNGKTLMKSPTELNESKRDTINYSKSAQNGYTDSNTNKNNTNNNIDIQGEMKLNLKENDYLNSSRDTTALLTPPLSPNSQSMTCLPISSPTSPVTNSMTSIMTDSVTNGLHSEKLKSSKTFIQSPRKWLTP
ncbi:unnamed protein product [Heterobilharzia americana]|nr:unnamed protein product [Heterobilharzia americana]